MCQICCLQNVSIKFDRVGGLPVLRSTKNPSTSRFKRRIRVFQSQIYRQQVVTRAASCFFVHGKEKFFWKHYPKNEINTNVCVSETTQNLLKEIFWRIHTTIQEFLFCQLKDLCSIKSFIKTECNPGICSWDR